MHKPCFDFVYVPQIKSKSMFQKNPLTHLKLKKNFQENFLWQLFCVSPAYPYYFCLPLFLDTALKLYLSTFATLWIDRLRKAPKVKFKFPDKWTKQYKK